MLDNYFWLVTSRGMDDIVAWMTSCHNFICSIHIFIGHGHYVSQHKVVFCISTYDVTLSMPFITCQHSFHAIVLSQHHGCVSSCDFAKDGKKTFKNPLHWV